MPPAPSLPPSPNLHFLFHRRRQSHCATETGRVTISAPPLGHRRHHHRLHSTTGPPSPFRRSATGPPLAFCFVKKYIQPFISSMIALEAGLVLQVAKDASGSHILESFISSNVSVKQKYKLY
ncbi:uncharacterized protein LOC116267879 [Nymphaea colorata]|nr:uncharacterized protein LOC116267879 [Nymphaea colorata]